LDVTLHTFEKGPRPEWAAERLEAAGVTWMPHPFHRGGSVAGLMRVLLGARYLRRNALVHARSDMAAASCSLTRHPLWLWDLRSLWRDQRMELGQLRWGSPEERVMRVVERTAARRSAAIVTLARAAVPILEERFGASVTEKVSVISTCVDLTRFPLTPLPAAETVRLLLAGTLNAVYDVPTMLRLLAALQQRRPAELHVLTPEQGPWHQLLTPVAASMQASAPMDVPEHLREAHVGLSLLKPGISTHAATPTKLAEFLASGRPVVVSTGIGDMDALLRDYRCGVVVVDSSEEAVGRAAEELDTLLEDPDTANRCRSLAEKHFDIDVAVDTLIDVYRRAVSTRG
jgi:glycosyltransferase involved in cell wall biosynthesis